MGVKFFRATNGALLATFISRDVLVFYRLFPLPIKRSVSSGRWGKQQDGLPVCDSVNSAKSRRQLVQDAPGMAGEEGGSLRQ